MSIDFVEEATILVDMFYRLVVYLCGRADIGGTVCFWVKIVWMYVRRVKNKKETRLFSEKSGWPSGYFGHFLLTSTAYKKGECHEALEINNGWFDALGYHADRDLQYRL